MWWISKLKIRSCFEYFQSSLQFHLCPISVVNQLILGRMRIVSNTTYKPFHIMFTWLLFTCDIILVFLLLALPWGSNMFYANVSGYKYICSQVHHSFSSLWRGETLSTFSLYCLSLYSVFCGLYPCCFCKWKFNMCIKHPWTFRLQ